MKRLILYLESLEKRERILLFLGIYGVIFILGIFYITVPNINKLEGLDRKIVKEIQDYHRLLKLTSQYISYKPKYREVSLSLSFVENLAEKAGIKDNITSLKPYRKGSIEVSFEKVDGERLTSFISYIKRKNLKITYFSMEDPKGNGELNVRMVISE